MKILSFVAYWCFLICLLNIAAFFFFFYNLVFQTFTELLPKIFFFFFPCFHNLKGYDTFSVAKKYMIFSNGFFKKMKWHLHAFTKADTENCCSWNPACPCFLSSWYSQMCFSLSLSLSYSFCFLTNRKGTSNYSEKQPRTSSTQSAMFTLLKICLISQDL